MQRTHAITGYTCKEPFAGDEPDETYLLKKAGD